MLYFPLKFRQIQLSGFEGELENVSFNQRPGRPSWFSDQPDNTNLMEDVKILLSVKFRKIALICFREVEHVKS